MNSIHPLQKPVHHSKPKETSGGIGRCDARNRVRSASDRSFDSRLISDWANEFDQNPYVGNPHGLRQIG